VFRFIRAIPARLSIYRAYYRCRLFHVKLCKISIIPNVVQATFPPTVGGVGPVGDILCMKCGLVHGSYPILLRPGPKCTSS
jgi:hypothetical protein